MSGSRPELLAVFLVIALAASLLVVGCQSEARAAGSTGLSPEDKAVLQAAIRANEARALRQTAWLGPTTGPNASAGRKIVYVANDSRDERQAAWGRAMEEAAGTIGWVLTTGDGQGTTKGCTDAFNRAMATDPDGIVTSCDAASIRKSLTEASQRKIPVIGLRSVARPGPDSAQHLWDTIGPSAQEIGKALADFIIADSRGVGRVIILYDAQDAEARLRAESMRAELATCSSCTLLAYVTFPLADAPSHMAQLASSWVSRYGTPLSVLAVTDSYFDSLVPVLRIGGLKPDDAKLVAADGSPNAYQRIRGGDYQVATAPEPLWLEGYQAIDEMNRALSGASPTGFVPPIHLVTKQNVDDEGGIGNAFDPGNDYRSAYGRIWRAR